MQTANIQTMAANPSDALERALHYPLGDTLPAPGTSLEVAPGVRWLRMGLPFALNHINLWLLRDVQDGVQGWTIVDCGIDNAPTRALWEQIFATELQGLPVLRVVVTHMHPDHMGLAHWLTERWSTPGAEDCRLWISATDWNAARVASHADTAFGGEGAARFFARHGISDPAALDQVRARTNYYASMVPKVPRRYRRLMDGLVLTINGHTWHCIVGYGHAPEHISLHCPSLNVLISGDMVLPRISTNISVIDLEPEASPLPLFLASLARLKTLPADTLVLPSHGKPFTGLHTRIQQLQQHHDDRLADVLAACTQTPGSACDMLPVLFKRTLDLHQTTFAMGESIAHLHALVDRGQLRPVAGEDGVLRFAAVA
jgi:glyoxylase-like metal-dependent hydrolase (beta-lactamase superfamily II)